jgi:hypothetical protein
MEIVVCTANLGRRNLVIPQSRSESPAGEARVDDAGHAAYSPSQPIAG